MQVQPLVIFLFGPTATGKTRAALYLAERLPCDLISVDSVQVYRGFDIGAAKPAREILRNFPHHLMNIREPADIYSVADFYQDAVSVIRQSLQRKRIPVLVGGSMMYFSMLERGLATLPPANEALRVRIQNVARRYGWSYWHRYLLDRDPQTAVTLAPKDRQRLQRAVEVWLQTGKSLYHLHQQQGQQEQQRSVHSGILTLLARTMPGVRLMKAGLAITDKPLHKQALRQRWLAMLGSGLLQEVDAMYHRPDLNAALPAVRSVGYWQVWQYIQGCLSYPQMLSEGLIANRRLAKHQMTWLRSWREVQLFYPQQQDDYCAAMYHAIRRLYTG